MPASARRVEAFDVAEADTGSGLSRRLNEERHFAQKRTARIALDQAPTKSVLHEEVHHISRSEELVADRELVGVARRLDLPHILSLVRAVEELVSPSECVRRRPFDLAGTRQQTHKLVKCRRARFECEARTARVEE